MLTARGLLTDPEPALNCTVRPLTSSSPADIQQQRGRSHRPVVQEISPRIFVASVQFERPFDYRSLYIYAPCGLRG